MRVLQAGDDQGLRGGSVSRRWGFVLAWVVLCGVAFGQDAAPKTRIPEGNGPAMSEKQKKLQEDMEKLVQMTADLKVSVDKSSKHELSLDVVRKAEAVEKLARSLKERIREAR